MTTATETAPHKVSTLPNGSETVLLVEDDEVARRVTRMILEDLGYRVLAADSGMQASKLNKSFGGEIHLLLSDVIMPDGNGVEWARRLRHDRPSMSTLFMSAYTREALQREGIPDPGDRFLQKPFPPVGLARKVREVLDH